MCDALVLKQHDLADVDRVLVLATPDAGRVHVKLKGAKRIRSKMAGHLEPGSRVIVHLVQGRSPLPVVTSVQSTEASCSVGLMPTLGRIGLRHHMLEVGMHSLVEGQEDRAVFAVLSQGMLALSEQMVLKRKSDMQDMRSSPLGVHRDDEGFVAKQQYTGESMDEDDRLACLWLRLLFDVAMSGALGQSPQLHRCAKCQNTLKEHGTYVSTQFGGGICATCARGDAAAHMLLPDAFRLLRFLQQRVRQKPIDAYFRCVVRMDKRVTVTSSDVMVAWMMHALQRPLRAFQWHVVS